MEITFSRKSRQERAKLAFPAATFPRSCRKNNRPMAGLLAPGSSFAPRLPILLDSGIVAAVVPGYSSGTATASHRTSLAQRTKTFCAGSPPFARAIAQSYGLYGRNGPRIPSARSLRGSQSISSIMSIPSIRRRPWTEFSREANFRKRGGNTGWGWNGSFSKPK